MKRLLKNFLKILGYEIIKYRPTLNDSLKNLIRKENPIVFDIGANKGQSIERFNQIFINPIIYSFEPIKECFDELIANYGNDVKIFNLAFGEKKEIKILRVNKDSGTSSFYKINQNYLNLYGNKEIKQQQVNVNTLDNFVKKNNINNIDLLKIDVQGFEKKILLGAKQILNNVKCIELEIIFTNYYDEKSSFKKIEDVLAKYNFTLYNISSPNYNANKNIQWLNVLYFNYK